jgi:hypothetical protein
MSWLRGVNWPCRATQVQDRNIPHEGIDRRWPTGQLVRRVALRSERHGDCLKSDCSNIAYVVPNSGFEFRQDGV